MIKKLNILILFLLGVQWLSAQTEVVLNFYNHTDQEFTVSDYGKIYFDNGYLFIYEGTGTPYSFELSGIQKMTFNHTVNIDDIEVQGLRIYPNPASDFIKIESQRERNNYRIYTMDGRLVLSGRSSNGESLDISRLSRGLYLINVDGKTFKITKL